MMNELNGLGVALITPFNAEGAVDHTALAKVVEHQIAGGVDYLVVMGTTGESATLSTSEKQQVLNKVNQLAAGRVPVVFGIGGNNTAAVIEQMRSFNLDGVTAILSVSPYYNKPTQEGIYQHYEALSAASPKPIILYNVPGRTMSNISAETTLRLARDHANIVAIKEASGNLDQIARIIRDRPQGFLVISGDDALTVPILALGGNGVVSVVGNVLPAEFARLVHAALKGDFKTARAAHLQLIEIIDLLFVEGNPGGVKEVAKALGLCGNQVRMPLVPVSQATAKRIAEALERIQPVVA